MFKQSLFSLALVILFEAISAVCSYLKHKLIEHIERDTYYSRHEYA